ncbi:hypothetical protein ACJMK2_019799 [Sinanodonta woodiana]|uniref:B30.2/SPRY domain-containing protein n=1 Tax=Sinanodonta woodiana TaxID=1069815 RepID=A0ABD3TZN1_SINWO
MWENMTAIFKIILADHRSELLVHKIEFTFLHINAKPLVLPVQEAFFRFDYSATVFISRNDVKYEVKQPHEVMNGKDVIRSLQNLITMDMVRQLRRHPSMRHAHIAGPVLGEDQRQARHERVNVDGDIISFQSNEMNRVGLYVAADPLSPEENYFEVEILDTGVIGAIGVGLVPQKYPMDSQPGWRAFSVGYHADDGKVFRACGFGRPFGPKCSVGDRVGCGIKFQNQEEDARQDQTVKVFFTRNSQEVGRVLVPFPAGGLFPAVGLHSDGEEVKLNLDAEWHSEDVMHMAVDSSEEEWTRLHDIKLNGITLEYAGRGKSIQDVGLAQARQPLDTMHHYFEIEILDPGENCYIAIGLARRSYPKHRHPGWNKGSIAYHAGDIMGCGILFPADYDSEVDCDLFPEDGDGSHDGGEGEDGYQGSDTDEEDLNEKNGEEEEEGGGLKVQIFFTRNGKIIGQRQVRIPKGGFYPTVGMLSSCEKVRVDLRPLTG